MKRILITLLVLCAAFLASAEVTYTFSGQSSTFDGSTNWVQVLLNDGGTDFTMTVSSSGGNLKALSGDFGIDGTSGTNDQLDGTDEVLTLSFSKAIDFVSMDLAGIGSDANDGANLTVGTNSLVTLHTGSPSSSVFNGTQDVYTPASPLRVNMGDTLVLTGSSVTSVYELEGITMSVVPEPATMAMFGIGGIIAFIIRRSVGK